MDQDELNKELDHFLEEGIFNGDLEGATAEQIRSYVCSMVKDVDGVTVSEEQWLNYANYCLQTSIENSLRKKFNSIQ